MMKTPILRITLLILLTSLPGWSMLSRHNEQGLSPTHSYKRSGASGVVSNLNGNLVVNSSLVNKSGAPLGVSLSRSWNSHWRDPLFVFQYDMNYNEMDPSNPDKKRPKYEDRDITASGPVDIGGFATRRMQIYDTPARIPEMWAFAQATSISMIESIVSQAINQAVMEKYASFLAVLDAKKSVIPDYKPNAYEQSKLDQMARERGAALQALQTAIYLMTSAKDDIALLGECASSATGGSSASGDCGDALLNAANGTIGTYVTATTGFPLIGYAQIGYNLVKGDMTAEDLAWTVGNMVGQQLVASIVGGGLAGAGAGVAVAAAVQLTRVYLALQAEWAKTFDVGIVQLNPWAIGVNGYVGMIGVNHDPELQRGQNRFAVKWMQTEYTAVYNASTKTVTSTPFTATKSRSRHPMPELQLVGADGGASRFVLSDDSARTVDGRRWVSYVSLSNSDRRKVMYCLPMAKNAEVVSLGLIDNAVAREVAIYAATSGDTAGFYMVKEPDGTQVEFGRGIDKGIVQDKEGFHAYWSVPTLVRHPTGDSIRIARDGNHRVVAAWDVRTGRGAQIDRSGGVIKYLDVVFQSGSSGNQPSVSRIIDTVLSGEGNHSFNVYTDKFGDHPENVGVVTWEARRVNATQWDTARFAYKDGDLTSIYSPNGSRTEYVYTGSRNAAQDGFVQIETEFPDGADSRFWRKRVYDYVGWTDSRPQGLKTSVTTILRTPDYVPNSATDFRESETTDWYHFSAQLAGVNVNRSLAGFKGQTTAIRPNGTIHDTDKVLDSMEYKTSRFQLVAEYHGAGAGGLIRKQMIYDGDRVIGDIASQGMSGRYAPVITTYEYDDQGSRVRERVCPHDLAASVTTNIQNLGFKGYDPSMLDLGCPEKETRYGIRHEVGSEFWKVRLDTLRVRDSAMGDIVAETWIGTPNASFDPRGLYQLGMPTSSRSWRVDPVNGDSLLLGDSTEYEDWRPVGQGSTLGLIRPVATRVYDPGRVSGEAWPIARRTAYADNILRPTLPAKNWKLTSATSANLTETDYDTQFKLFPVTSRAYVAPTTPGGSGAGTALTTTRAYDLDRGWVTSETAPGNRTTTTEYDRSGRVVKKIAPDGGTTTTKYQDRLEALSSWRSAGSAGVGYTPMYPNQRTVAVRETDPGGVTTEARFDGLGRMVAMRKLSVGATTTTTDTSKQQTTLVSYNQWDKLQWKCDADGRQEFHNYDGVGRLTSSKVYLYPEVASDLSLAWENRYDWHDSTKVLIETDPLGTRTVFHADLMGRDTLIERDAERLDIQTTGDSSAGLAVQAGPERIRVRQHFDNFGNVVRVEDPKGLVETRRYDVRNRLRESRYPDDLRHAVGYDLAGRVVADTMQGMRNGAPQTDSIVAKSLTYDGLDRVASETWQRGGTGNASTGFSSREDVRFAWDSHGGVSDPGQLLAVERGTGVTATYSYDLNGRRTNRSVSASGIGYTATQGTTFDLSGAVTASTLPGGARFRQGYDVFHRSSLLALVQGSDSVPLWHGASWRRNDLQDGFRLGARIKTSFQYEGKRSLLTENLATRLNAGTSTVRDTLYRQALEWDASGNVAGMSRLGDSVGFQHDRLGQLRVTTRKNGFDTLEYDANGNRVRHRYSMDAAVADSFRVTANRTTGGQTARKGYTLYKFDVLGNQVLEADFATAGDSSELSRAWRIVERRFNRRNELERVVVRNRVNGDSSAWAYAYDEAGNRIQKRWVTLPIVGTDTGWKLERQYVYDGVNMVADSGRGDSSWSWWGFQGYKRLAWAERPGTRLRVRYILTDHLGTGNILVDDTGAVLSRYMLDPWGNVELAWETVPLRYRYTGKEQDLEVGGNVTYVNARFLDNERGSWISRDPKLEFWTPYSALGGMVLKAIDTDGAEVLINAEDAVAHPEYVLPTLVALVNISNTQAGRKMLMPLVLSKVKYEIRYTEGRLMANRGSHTMFINPEIPSDRKYVMTSFGWMKVSLEEVMMHEFRHMTQNEVVPDLVERRLKMDNKYLLEYDAIENGEAPYTLETEGWQRSCYECRLPIDLFPAQSKGIESAK